MRILFVLPETPEMQGGGIATYLGHSRRALLAAGHDVFVLTWVLDDEPTKEQDVNGTRVVTLQKKAIMRAFPEGPWNIAASFALLPSILKAIDDFGPDIIESSDYLAPLFGYLSYRRAGLLRPSQRLPTIVYNHGLVGELYRANAVIPNSWARRDLSAERVALRWADMCFVPSSSAMVKLDRQMGSLGNTALVREPYFWSGEGDRKKEVANRFIHTGRISYAKGIDRVIHFLNVTSSFVDIEKIMLVGSIEETSFSEQNGKTYVLKRLDPRIREKVEFTGKVDRSEIPKTIAPDNRASMSMNFSLQETFNYVFLENIDHGLKPFTMDETAMAEFYPNELRGLLIPLDFDLRDLRKIYERTVDTLEPIEAQIREHATTLTDPKQFAETYGKHADALIKRVTGSTPPRRERPVLGGSDVTVLMASYNCKDTIDEAVNSVLSQSVHPREIIILDDGTRDVKSLQLLASMERHSLVRVVRSTANEGLCSSRRKLIDLCKTSLSIFLDDDDFLESTYIDKTLLSMNNCEFSADAVITWRKNFGESENTIISYNLEDYDHYIENELRMTCLIKTEVLKSVNFRPSMRNGEADDWDFWVRFKQAGYRATLLAEPLFRYRLHLGSMSWPWSHGQAALTADLLAPVLNQALLDKKVAPDVVLALLNERHIAPFRLWSSGSSQSDDISGWRRRVDDVLTVRRRRPLSGALLYFVFKLVSSIAKRLK